jgi:hypothetical protein
MFIFGIVMIGVAGCASHQDRVPRVVEAASWHFEPAPAAALVFDPPMVAYGPLPAFSREGRSPSAFYGYESPVIDSLQIYQRDEQRINDYPNRFNRTGYSGRSMTTYR